MMGALLGGLTLLIWLLSDAIGWFREAGMIP